MRKFQAGFTLIELMIVIAIIGILASISVPQYLSYTKRAKFSEIVLEANNTRKAVEACYSTTNLLSDCSDGQLYIDTPVNNRGLLLSLSVNQGKITAEAVPKLNNATYILTPQVSNNSLIWQTQGSCKTLAYCVD